MKKLSILFIGAAAGLLTILVSHCNKEETNIVGKWQHVLTINQNDTIDLKDYPMTTNTFRKDSTLYITNGKQEVNVRYFVKDSNLYSYQLSSYDTSIMRIETLSKEDLVLRVNFIEENQEGDRLVYKRLEE